MSRIKDRVLKAGVVELAAIGSQVITARHLGDRIGVSHSNVAYYWKTSADLLDAVAIEAIRTNNKKAVARLIADGHSSVAEWSQAKRRAYLVALA